MKGEEILRLVDGLHRNKEIDKEVIFRAIEAALLSAAKKHFGQNCLLTIEIDRKTGDVQAYDEQVPLNPETLGRIAAQTAKQVIMQRIREAECDVIYEDYETRKASLITGQVQRFESGAIIVNLDRTEGYLPRSEQIPGEHYQPGERIRALVRDVKRSGQKVRILLSRTDKEFLKRLFELEVPEVADGIVQIHVIAREAGHRTKIAVSSRDSRVDCIGACVGVRGTRIKTIIDELNGEKIDIIQWAEAPEVLIRNTLKPAEILEITLEEGENTRRATVVVPPDQLSLAIGRRGQNVRLAARMTGWDIDIQTTRTEEEAASAAAAAEAAAETEGVEPAAAAVPAETADAAPEAETSETPEPTEATDATPEAEAPESPVPAETADATPEGETSETPEPTADAEATEAAEAAPEPQGAPADAPEPETAAANQETPAASPSDSSNNLSGP